MGRNILKSSLENASFSIIFQILFRSITFILNAFIIRTVGHEVLGIMNVRLLLLESTILFLCKEPILKACLTNSKSHNWAQVINQIWLSVPFSAILSVVLVYVWLYMLTPVEEIYKNQYYFGCFSIGISCVIEQMAQSVVIVAQSFCFVKLKVVLETLYVVVRTFIFVFFVIRNTNHAIWSFGVAQIVSVIVLCFSYYLFFMWYIWKLEEKEKPSKLFENMKDFPFRNVFDFLPFHIENKDSLLNRELWMLTVSFAKQSVVKQVLTEGEKYVMTISPVLTLTEQSIYDIVNNLGSLAARFIFRPIEESAYFYFTQMIQRNVPLKLQNQQFINESSMVLKNLCNVIVSIGLIILTFGQTYSFTLLYIYGGHKLVSNILSITLLKFHCFAVILLAINGVTESFMFATMSNDELDRYNYKMVIFSVIFLLVSYILTVLCGPVGFILANCVNMSTRIIHSLFFISNLYKDTNHKPLEGLKPSKKFMSVLILSWFSTRISEEFLVQKSMIFHIFIGAVFFFITLAVWSFDNKDLLKIAYGKYRKMSLKHE